MTEKEPRTSCIPFHEIRSSRSSASCVLVQNTYLSPTVETSITKALERAGMISSEQWENERHRAFEMKRTNLARGNDSSSGSTDRYTSRPNGSERNRTLDDKIWAMSWFGMAWPCCVTLEARKERGHHHNQLNRNEAEFFFSGLLLCGSISEMIFSNPPYDSWLNLLRMCTEGGNLELISSPLRVPDS